MTKRAGLSAALLISFLCAALAAIAWPPLTGRVNDGANLLSTATRSALESKLADLENRSSIQLVVATVPSLQDNDIETFANGLFRAWRLGEAKSNNGVLLVVAPTERKVRVEVGYGMEGTITDALSSVIISSAIVPKFKAADFSGGVTAGVDALIEAMTNDQSEWHRKIKVRQDANEFDGTIPFLVIVLVIIILMVMSRNARGPGRWVRRGNQSVFLPGPPGGGWSSGSSWGGGSWTSGSSGGDSGGFSGGGGSSGGGGASGSW